MMTQVTMYLKGFWSFVRLSKVRLTMIIAHVEHFLPIYFTLPNRIRQLRLSTDLLWRARSESESFSFERNKSDPPCSCFHQLSSLLPLLSHLKPTQQACLLKMDRIKCKNYLINNKLSLFSRLISHGVWNENQLKRITQMCSSHESKKKEQVSSLG